VTARIRLDDMTDDQLDQLYGQLDAANGLLRRYVNLADVTHAYRIMGGHDTLAAGLACAGCELAEQARTHLGQP
jgi:hypothetical protein